MTRLLDHPGQRNLARSTILTSHRRRYPEDMTRVSFDVPDELAARIHAAAGTNPSAWFEAIAKDALLKQEAAAVAEFETTHADEAWERERWAA
ncbi:hypothetical protein [Catenuloplanes indicus]|uniref:Uncharacterized protein n=1 Tax=Catenuloplanes indicus TaxID=137267 RepID=A0AAE3W7W4_9ACTN|nr:hypothetical protein [Catenuloplanes indicus]MDQ0371653.1 hypothetical protein [Catenuloplanes indicus]